MSTEREAWRNLLGRMLQDALEVVSFFLQERAQQPIDKQIVDVPAPQILEEVTEQERAQQRIEKQTVDGPAAHTSPAR